MTQHVFLWHSLSISSSDTTRTYIWKPFLKWWPQWHIFCIVRPPRRWIPISCSPVFSFGVTSMHITWIINNVRFYAGSVITNLLYFGFFFFFTFIIFKLYFVELFLWSFMVLNGNSMWFVPYQSLVHMMEKQRKKEKKERKKEGNKGGG